jgi:hypothetical protein
MKVLAILGSPRPNKSNSDNSEFQTISVNLIIFSYIAVRSWLSIRLRDAF